MRRPAFSLLELLLAMTAGMMVLLIAATVLGDAGEKCGRVKAGAGVRREFRLGLEEWKSDLASTVSGMPAHLYVRQDREAGDRFGFFLLRPPSKQSEARALGDLCAVIYYLKDLESRGQSVRCLVRGLRESAEVYAAMKQGDEKALFEPRDADEPVMFGVVTFEARPKIRKASEWKDWDVKEAKRPQAIEWRIEVARRDLEQRLETPAQWDALIGERTARDAKQIEVQSGIAAFGHEAIR
jgi:hypothetical protein